MKKIKSFDSEQESFANKSISELREERRLLKKEEALVSNEKWINIRSETVQSLISMCMKHKVQCSLTLEGNIEFLIKNQSVVLPFCCTKEEYDKTNKRIFLILNLGESV